MLHDAEETRGFEALANAKTGNGWGHPKVGNRSSVCNRSSEKLRVLLQSLRTGNCPSIAKDSYLPGEDGHYRGEVIMAKCMATKC